MAQRGPCVILVRHGETKLNSQVAGASAERIRGWRDVPLDDSGHRAAKAVTERLRAKFDRIDRLATSPLQRATATAKPVGRAFGLMPAHAAELMPWNVGDWAGKLAREVVPRMNELVEHEDVIAPGGERFATFRERFLRYLAKSIRKSGQMRAVSVLVTHTRNVQCARAWLAAGMSPRLTIDFRRMCDYSDEVPPGGMLLLSLSPTAAQVA